MGGLRTVVILLTLGALGGDAPPAGETAPARTEAPDPNPGQNPTPTPTPVGREAPDPNPGQNPTPAPIGTEAPDSNPGQNPTPTPAPVPPIQYLKAGIMFFNTGKYEQAGKYFEAADRFRDQLKEKERVVLDVYWDALETYREELRLAASPPAKDPAIVQASRVTVEPPKNAVAKASPNPDPPKEPARPAELEKPLVVRQRAAANDTKQTARWLLHEARELIQRGNFDLAVKKVEQARSLDVRWGFLDETPDKVAKAIEYYRKRRPAMAKSADSKDPAASHDLRTAQARLQEARVALSKNQVDQAEEIARDVQGWGLDFSKSDDSPDKLLATVRTLKLLEMIQKGGGMIPSDHESRTPE
jgi:tetratricopeptide (TPR) repeat protein